MGWDEKLEPRGGSLTYYYKQTDSRRNRERAVMWENRINLRADDISREQLVQLCRGNMAPQVRVRMQRNGFLSHEAPRVFDLKTVDSSLFLNSNPDCLQFILVNDNCDMINGWQREDALWYGKMKWSSDHRHHDRLSMGYYYCGAQRCWMNRTWRALLLIIRLFALSFLFSICLFLAPFKNRF